MTTIPDSLGMRHVAHTWYDPAPRSTAHRVRTVVRWAFWSLVALASVAFIFFCDFHGSIL